MMPDTYEKTSFTKASLATIKSSSILQFLREIVISLVNDGAELLLLYTPVLKLVLRTIFNWVLKKVLDYEKKTDNQLLTMSIR